MRQVIRYTASAGWAVPLVILSLVTTGCGWEKTMEFRSPSKRSAIQILQTRFANEWGTRIQLVTSNHRTELGRINREAIIYFVHVYWSPDEKQVGVLATGFNFSRVAYDLERGKPIPFEEIQKDLGFSIAQTYNVPPGEDPIQWAAMADAGIAFSKRHPEIKLSYH